MQLSKRFWTVIAVVSVVGIVLAFGTSLAFSRAGTGSDHDQHHSAAATEACSMNGMSMEDCSKMHGGKMPCGMDAKACSDNSKSGNMKNCPMQKAGVEHSMHGH